MALNPSVGSDCLIIAGEYYCAQGVADPSSSSISISVASSTTVTPTTSTTTSSSRAPTTTTGLPCAKSYTVVPGDYCYKIWTDNGLTEAQLRALNPSLNANCDLAVGQVLCVT